MAKREIATTIAVEGEKAFKSALADAAREMRVLGSELKAVSAEFEVNGNKQEFLATKSQILSRELDQQKAIVKGLEAAMQSATTKFGQGSKEADGYAIQLNNARAKAEGLQKELNATEKELEDIDDGMEDATKESRSFARAMENNVEEAAEDSEKALKGLGQELLDMRQSLDDIRSMEGVQLGMDIAGGAWDAAQALFDYTEEARDYNRQLAMLEINAGNARIDYAVAEAEAFEAAAYIGDLDSALEGVNELLAAGLDTTQFIQSMDLLTGAALRFPDTLKFESLADGLQETLALATGQGAGQFAELLERLGVDMDGFNTGLAAAKKNGEEVEYVLTYLSQHGLADTKRQFGETNGTMVEAEAATLRLEKAWMSFGEVLDPMLTDWKNFFADTLEWAASGIEKMNNALNSGIEKDAARTEQLNEKEIGVGTYLVEGYKDMFKNQLEYWGIQQSDVQIDRDGTGGGVHFDVIDDLTTEMQDAADEAATSGAAISTNLSAGIDEAAPLAVASTQSMVQQVQDLLDSVTVPDYAGMAAAGLAAAQGVTANMPPIVMQLNGRRVGQLITPYVSTQQAKPVG